MFSSKFTETALREWVMLLDKSLRITVFQFML